MRNSDIRRRAGVSGRLAAHLARTRARQTRRRLILTALIATIFLSLAWSPTLSTTVAQDETRQSQPGEYRGYSKPLYTEWVRSSQYLTVRDGTQLAADIFRPSRERKAVEDALPVVWAGDRYHRSTPDGRGGAVSQLDMEPWLQTLVKYGYVVAVVDVRGSGASFGTTHVPFSVQEANDAYDVTEWLAAQKWCNGNVGMFGRSYLGITQYLAAGAAPPHLKAIFPEMAMFDLYSFAYPGGAFRDNFFMNWGKALTKLDTVALAAPVDDDRAGEKRAQAVAAHKSNGEIFQLLKELPYRDSKDKKSGILPYQVVNPAARLDAIRKSGVAIYHLGGWSDMWPRDTLLWYKNLDNPQKLIIGPWSHEASHGLSFAAEHLRWYDYWLKGIDNGIMREPPIHYFTNGAPRGQEWRAATQWPLPETVNSNFYFQPEPSGSINSPHDKSLSTTTPASGAGKVDYTVDYTTTSGAATRWTNGYGAPFGYQDMKPNDQKALTFTSPPLTSNTEVTGHPVVHLWVTSTASDGDFFVYLEAVTETGFSQYITEGVVRASHRATSTPSFDNLGLPFQRSFGGDVAPLPAEPVELVFDLHPISNIFPAGQRIRVTVAGADTGNVSTPALSPPPTVSVYHNAQHASYITLPIIPSTPNAAPAAATQTAVAPNWMNNSWRIILLVLFVSGAAAVTATMLMRRRRNAA